MVDKKERPQFLLKFLSIWFFLGALLPIGGSILGLIFNEAIISWIFTQWGDQIHGYLNFQEVISLALGVEIFLLLLGVLNFICTCGLILKNRKLWRITIYYQLIIAWTLIG
ncbi:MAG: hypothetical protein ACOC44_12220 [Promethearchaeia archaeon]